MSGSKESLLTTDLLQHRLNTGLGIAGGARGSLTKCAVQLLSSGNNDLTTNNNSSSKAATLVTDFRLQQIEMTKLVLTVQRNELELKSIMEEEETAVTSTNSDGDIKSLRNELHLQRQVQSCLEEYEALAKLTVARHAVSEHKLQQDIKKIEVAHAAALTDLQAAAAACMIRQSQFHLLQQCLQDLKQSLNEPLDIQPGEMERAAAAEIVSGGAESSADVDDGNKMDVDVPIETNPSNEEEEDEDGELYGDL